MKCRPAGWFEWGIVRAQPVHECTYFVVPPHPGRKARKGCPLGGTIFHVTDVVIDARRIRPVSLDGHEPETLLGDQLAGNAVAHSITKIASTARKIFDRHCKKIFATISATSRHNDLN